RHEAIEWCKEVWFAMYIVKSARLLVGELHHPRSNDLGTCLLEVRYNLPALSGVKGVGLDDGECSVASHFMISVLAHSAFEQVDDVDRPFRHTDAVLFECLHFFCCCACGSRD